MEQARDRLAVLKKIAEYEKNGWFDRDVEDDPPSRPLRPGECDYTGRKLSSKIVTWFSNILARRYFDGCIRRGELVIKEIRGIEHYLAVKDKGVILTANHFNPDDNYAIYKALQPYLGRKNLYKIIREGNYTGFGGLYGFFFRHCNTLPLGSSVAVWREFTTAVSILLARREKILIYPEQGMWWNYKKPRPLKPGAFRLAVKDGAPVLPVFITLEDTDRIGADGFPIQAYTLHFLPAIFPDNTLPLRQCAAAMAQENYDAWKTVYEQVYQTPLTYTTQ